LADKVANSLECCLLLENALDCVSPQLDEKLNETINGTNKPCDDHKNVDSNVQLTSEFLSATKLKKKEVPSKNLRRKKTWLDKLLKRKRKPTKVAASKKKVPKVCCKGEENLLLPFIHKLLTRIILQQQKDYDGGEQVGVENDESDKGVNMDSRVQHNHQLRAALNSSPWWCL
jgi:hypothetical protein